MHDRSPNSARLGEIGDAALTWHFPIIRQQPEHRFALSDTTALRLTEVLVVAPRDRVALLNKLLAYDPSFAGWSAACAAGQLAPEAPLVLWLSERLSALLRWPEDASALPASIWLLQSAAERSTRLDLLESSFEDALQHAKLESLKELAYGASHEINNPLANISMRAQSLLTDERDPERRRKLAQIHVQAMRAHEMIADLMLFARPPKLSVALVDVRAITLEQVSSLTARANEQGTTLLLVDDAVPATIQADATQLGVALRAIIINALEVLGSGGAIRVGVRQGCESLRPGELPVPAVKITVEDNGPGVADSAIPHLFDPFFSGREAGRGLGFGLTKAWRIINAHGGQISHAVPAGGGAAFSIVLPAAN
jgi:signal transduction histidine kinase